MQQPGQGGFGDGFDRKCRLMVESIVDIIQSDAELGLCEGLRLLEATRCALARVDAASADRFDLQVLPHIRRHLLERFGIDPLAGMPTN